MKFPIDNVDLCAGEIRVSPQGLQRLAEIAAFASRCDCERLLSEIQNTNRESSDCHNNGTHAYLSAERLKHAAANLEVALRFRNAFDSLVRGERDTILIYPQK